MLSQGALSHDVRSFGRHGALSHDVCGVLGVTVRSIMMFVRRGHGALFDDVFWESPCALWGSFGRHRVLSHDV